MAEQKQASSATIHKVPEEKKDSTLTLRIPKPNIQVVVLGLVAFITLFQTFQLIRISGSSSTITVKTAPAATTTSGGTGTGSNANTPQSMVGGC